MRKKKLTRFDVTPRHDSRHNGWRVIAGLIDFLTTRYDRRLMRREAYLREHKDNFRTIERALLSVREQVWPIDAKGFEDLWLPKWNNPPLGNWLKKYSIVDFVSVQESFGREGSYVIAIDPVLYSDIENHFPHVYSMLVAVERRTRTDGFELAQLLFDVSKIVYDHLSASDLLVLKWTFDHGGVKPPLREIVSVNTNESQWYAGAVFLMVIGEDTGNWPIEYAQLERYGLVEGLQNLARQIRT